MTIQGGGGGKKIPGPSGIPAATATKATSTTTTTTTAAATPTTTPTSAPPARDGFEHIPTDPRSPHSAGFLASEQAVSGIDSMVRVLEDTRSQILDEHKALREKAHKLVAALARSGFERTLLDEKRAELDGLRQRLAALRKRLQHIQRRLKTALGKTAKGDVDLSKSIQTHLEKMKKLEPGMQRALLALLAMEQAFAVADGSVLKLVGDATAEARGSALARLTPGSVVARATTAVLSGKPASGLAPADDEVDGLSGLRAVAETLLASV